MRMVNGRLSPVFERRAAVAASLPEGHVLPFGSLFQKIIDHRRAEQRCTAPIGPERALKIEREQSHRLAAPETFAHPFMHCDIDKGILDGGHVETYSGTTGPCEAFGFLMKLKRKPAEAPR